VVFVCHNSGWLADVLFNSPVILTAIASLSHQAGVEGRCFSRQADATGRYISQKADACRKAADNCRRHGISAASCHDQEPRCDERKISDPGRRTERGNAAVQAQPCQAGTREIPCSPCFPWRGAGQWSVRRFELPIKNAPC